MSFKQSEGSGSVGGPLCWATWPSCVCRWGATWRPFRGPPRPVSCAAGLRRVSPAPISCRELPLHHPPSQRPPAAGRIPTPG